MSWSGVVGWMVAWPSRLVSSIFTVDSGLSVSAGWFILLSVPAWSTRSKGSQPDGPATTTQAIGRACGGFVVYVRIRRHGEGGIRPQEESGDGDWHVGGVPVPHVLAV